MEQVLTFFWENRDAIFIIVLSVLLGFEVDIVFSVSHAVLVIVSA